MKIDVQRFLLVRVGGKVRHRIDVTGCWWCTETALCAVCAGKAEKARQGIARTDARRKKSV